MTENKRFWSVDYSVGYYTEIVDNDKELANVPNPKKNLTIEEVVDLLNELNDENEQLKKSVKRQQDSNNECAKLIKEQQKENEQLKSVNQELRNELSFDEKMYKTFKEIIDEADDLITSHLSKHYQRKWKNFCKHRSVLDD